MLGAILAALLEALGLRSIDGLQLGLEFCRHLFGPPTPIDGPNNLFVDEEALLAEALAEGGGILGGPERLRYGGDAGARVERGIDGRGMDVGPWTALPPRVDAEYIIHAVHEEDELTIIDVFVDPVVIGSVGITVPVHHDIFHHEVPEVGVDIQDFAHAGGALGSIGFTESGDELGQPRFFGGVALIALEVGVDVLVQTAVVEVAGGIFEKVAEEFGIKAFL